MIEHVLYFDVSKRQKNLICAYIIQSNDGNIIEQNFHKVESKMGTNCGECLSLIFGLERARLLGIKKIKVYGDSLIIINQINGLFKIKHHILKDLHKQVDTLKECFETIEFIWIPREQNIQAHRLTRCE